MVIKQTTVSSHNHVGFLINTFSICQRVDGHPSSQNRSLIVFLRTSRLFKQTTSEWTSDGFSRLLIASISNRLSFLVKSREQSNCMEVIFYRIVREQSLGPITDDLATIVLNAF